MKIAIVGNGILTRHLAPFDDLSWTTWGLSLREFEWQNENPPRPFHILWECHDYEGSIALDEDYCEFMRNNPIARPHRSLCKDLAGNEGFKSSIAYMIAEAIMSKPTEIALYGIDACVIEKEEYGDQIPNIKYFMGLAVGRGIKVSAPEICELFETSMYGMDFEVSQQKDVP